MSRTSVTIPMSVEMRDRLQRDAVAAHRSLAGHVRCLLETSLKLPVAAEVDDSHPVDAGMRYVVEGIRR